MYSNGSTLVPNHEEVNWSFPHVKEAQWQSTDDWSHVETYNENKYLILGPVAAGIFMFVICVLFVCWWRYTHQHAQEAAGTEQAEIELAVAQPAQPAQAHGLDRIMIEQFPLLSFPVDESDMANQNVKYA
ncbi:hypothetical protein RHMOL_Rhmol02G0280400 [Rhododendron molle]|uniref:Uncharacterized protein n=1 Tax=Rhododendron molle TaxID=49168 RepID=A0ACC0PWA9_RHOML|nr:hypothetical protein RHMOL_Rhmol02G0280400 [Rhododendron molle]